MLRHALAIGFGISTLAAAGAAAGAACSHENSLASHVGHVMWCWDDTPDNHGLMVIAEAEAAIALQHAGLALADPADLASIRLHLGHVINAVDPALEPEGPGLGYGLILAAEGAVVHIGFALEAESMFAAGDGGQDAGGGYDYGDGDTDADGDDLDSALDDMFRESTPGPSSEVVAVHAVYAIQSIANATTWATEALVLAQSARQQDDVARAAAGAQAVLAAVRSVIEGRDLDGDGRIAVEAGEGGLDQANQAMAAIIDEEGLSMPASHSE